MSGLDLTLDRRASPGAGVLAPLGCPAGGADRHVHDRARISLVELTGVLLGVADLTWLLPGQEAPGLKAAAADDPGALRPRRTLGFRR
jgi:hypothetical protein